MEEKDIIFLAKNAFSRIFDWEVYANPSMFYLLLLVPVLLAYLVFRVKKDQKVLQFSSSSFLNGMGNGNAFLVHIPEFLMLLALTSFVFALARPQEAYSWEEEKAKGIDIVIAMDLSSSMLAQDFKPSRVEASKDIAAEFIKGRESDRFGLVVFAGESFTQCPLTIDHKRMIELFATVETGVLKDGTAIGSGLATATKRLKDSDAVSKVVILLTDGENNSGDISPSLAADLAKRFGIKVYTIGVGKKGFARAPVAYDMRGNFIYDKVKVNIDEKTLKEVAEKTGGKYFRATGNEKLKEIYKEIDELEKTELASIKYNSKTELFLPFAVLGVMLVLVSKILEVTLFKKLIIS